MKQKKTEKISPTRNIKKKKKEIKEKIKNDKKE